jgi:hypothetical protein
MQFFESGDCLDEDTPNLMLLKELLFLFVVDYLLVKVAIIGKLHDYAAYLV